MNPDDIFKKLENYYSKRIGMKLFKNCFRKNQTNGETSLEITKAFEIHSKYFYSKTVKNILLLGTLLTFFLHPSKVSAVNSEKLVKHKKPNIVLFLVDDLGYGDVGCYGSKISTPNIDQLASEGMRFTDFHTNGPMSSPTRAALLTGIYQQRLGERFEGPLSAKRRDKGFTPKISTIADILKQTGYVTGKYGKWHLGFDKPYIPNNYGFDEFIGLHSGDGDHHTHINRWGEKDWWHNKELNMENGYSVDLITNHSIDFIEDHQNEPFFLYVSHLAIHFPWQGPDDPPHRQADHNYEDDKWGIIENKDNVRPHVKSMIQAVDQSLGKIVNKLRQLDLEKETLVFFTSDNGGYIHYAHEFHNISSNGPLRGQKGQVFEGGHRVPAIAWWPGKIEAGTEYDEPVMTMDFYPTFAELAGARIPEEKNIDGVNILPVLLKSKTLPERTLFWKIGEEWAVRKGPWKLVESENEKFLFNLKNDIEEEIDISSEHPELVKELTKKYQNWKQEVSLYAEKWRE